MPLYGHELDEDTDPLSAGLGFAVKLDKDQAGDGPAIPRFIGQDALQRIKDAGVPKQLVGLKIEGKRTPRQHAEVHANGGKVGEVTSGCMSPTLGLPIAMAYVTPGSVNEGDTVSIPMGSKTIDATVCKTPFYKRAK